MPVHFELVEEVLFLLMWSPWSCKSVLVRLRLLQALRVDRGPLGTDGRAVGDDRQDLDRGGPGRMVLVQLLQMLRASMSPWEVVARMSSSAVPSFLRALLT